MTAIHVPAFKLAFKAHIKATSREMVLWAAMGVVAAALLAALWSLCNEQVRKAEQREASALERRLALSDCLMHMPRSTFHSCLSVASAATGATAATGAARMSAQASIVDGAVPVNFSFR